MPIEYWVKLPFFAGAGFLWLAALVFNLWVGCLLLVRPRNRRIPSPLVLVGTIGGFLGIIIFWPFGDYRPQWHLLWFLAVLPELVYVVPGLLGAGLHLALRLIVRERDRG